MRRDLLFAASMAATALLVPACSQAPTQLIVVVDTDYTIPSELDELQLVVTGPDGMQHTEHQAVAAARELPFTLTLVPAGTSLGPVRVEASGLHDGTIVVTRTARVTLVAQQTLMLPMFLLRICGARGPCAAGQTCGDDGSCVSIDTDPIPWMGQPLRIGEDAGVHDAGHDAAGLDAGPLVDGGPPMDTGPPIDSAVDAGGTPDGGPGPDASVDCRTAGCDDGQVCTEDVCGGDGTCTHTPNTVACDDHVFCNGMDTCGSGTCSAHAGDPCGSGTTCDEPGGRCVGCTTDGDCPAQMTGSFGACGGFASTCGTAGMQSRTVRTFHCSSNSCVPSDVTEMQACSRASTDGSSCGSSSCGTFGACAGFGGTCGTSGTQSRTCTDLNCSGGSCAPTMRTDTQGCSRSTDGVSCMATSCTTFGACGGFADTCATSGTQSRTCTDYACSGGGCSAGAPRTETQGCSRSTDGTSCGTTSCGGYGACPAYADTCATSSSQSRTCTDYACSGGTCTSTPRTETQVCMTRATDGVVCDNDPDNCQNIHCLAGECTNGITTCSGAAHCCYPGCRTGICP